MPILMFDKDGNYCALRLEEVRTPFNRAQDARLTLS